MTDRYGEFKVGDRVILVDIRPWAESDLPVKFGETGEVVHLHPSGEPTIGVRWDNGGAHDCNGNCEFGHGYYVNPHNIELVCESPDIEIPNDDLFQLL